MGDVMRKMNNRGYMLVEIVLAFAITFSLIYFIMDLVINLKNKNDDLLVETLVKTDQSIITNKLMDYVMAEEENFDCNKLKDGISDKVIKYGSDVIDIVDESVIIDKNNVTCNIEFGKVGIVIPIEVVQSEENFDIIIDYKYKIGDIINPSCSLSVSGTTITAKYSDNDGGSGIDLDLVKSENSDWNFVNNDTATMTIDKTGNYILNVKDIAGNSSFCELNVDTTNSYEYVSGSYQCGSYACGSYQCGTRSCNCVSKCVKHYRGECAVDGWVTSCGSCPTYCTSYCPSYCDSYSTGYNCDSGYTKINDSYCYKLG